MEDQMMQIMYDIITSGLTNSFDDQMIAYKIHLEALKANPALAQFRQNQDPVFFHPSHPENLTSKLSWVLGYLQNLVPTFIQQDLWKWKWSEKAHPTRTKEENLKLLTFTEEYFKNFLEGVELLLNVSQFNVENNPMWNYVIILQDLKFQLIENALIVHVQPIDSCVHETPCICALEPVQAVKEATNFGMGVKFLADPCELPAPDAEAESTKKVRSKRKGQDQGQSQSQRTFKIFIITEGEAAILHESWKQTRNPNQSQNPGPLISTSTSSPVQHYVQDSTRNFMAKKNIKIKGNEYTFGTLKIQAKHKPESRGPTVKSVLLITSTVNISILGQSKDVEVWTLSVPVVYMSSRTQECAATATFFWDNYFQQKNRSPFKVEEDVPWNTFKEAVNLFFKYATGTSRGLTNNDLQYYGKKIFKKKPHFEADNLSVNRLEFCACKYNNEKKAYEFNPWAWLYHIITLIADHLKHNWENGKIVGFIDRTEAEGFLNVQGPGAFLFRFSDSKLGGISISACTAAGISSVAPIVSEGLKVISLEQRLRSLVHCQTAIVLDMASQIYVAQPKESAFVIPAPPTPEPSESGSESKGKKPYDPSELAMEVIGPLSNLSIQSPQNLLVPTPTPSPFYQPSSPSTSPAPAPFIHGYGHPEGYGYSSPGSSVPSPMPNYPYPYSPDSSSYYSNPASPAPSAGSINNQVNSPASMPMPIPTNMDRLQFQVPGMNQPAPGNPFDLHADYPMDQQSLYSPGQAAPK